MTKAQRQLHKVGNAIRAYHGGLLTAPQKKAALRIARLMRLHGIGSIGGITPREWERRGE